MNKLRSLIPVAFMLCFSSLVLAGGPPAQSRAPFLELSDPIALGEGEVRVFGSVVNGYPLGMGIVFDGGVFINAPQEHSDGKWDVLDSNGDAVWECCGHELDFDAPDNIAAVTSFEHIVLNWNPHGHPPMDIYTLPHFDFHFYTQTRAERIAITPPAAEDMCNDNIYGIPVVPLDCDQLDMAMAPLPADQQPPNHITVGAVEPGMGNHMIDPTSSEFTGETFTHTFIFGTWDGELTFWEPMVTADYLQSVRHKCFAIANPAAAPEAGWYPSQYCIEHNKGLDQYSVMLTDFEWLPASGL
jgi:hypothetical protein